MDDDKNCYGGLSAQRYRKLIEDDQTKAEYISCMMKVPKTVYRYRKFGSEDAAGSWKENSYWEDDVAGICMFSKAECFSGINDSHDCEVNSRPANIGKRRNGESSYRRGMMENIGGSILTWIMSPRGI